jgi:cellulose biosynthesis protein BcsQ
MNSRLEIFEDHFRNAGKVAATAHFLIAPDSPTDDSGPCRIRRPQRSPTMHASIYRGTLLFAQGDSSTWTEKELLFAIGSTLAVTISVVLVIIKLMAARHKMELKKATAEIARLEKKLDGGNGASLGPAVADLQQKLQQAQQEVGQLQVAYANSEDTGQTKNLTIERLETDLKSLGETLEQHRSDLATERRRIQKALRKDGQTWTERVLASAPDFKPLDPDDRRTPIISVLNLKGGVGKTTITANLGAALDAMGYRALLLDLDLQGSLTGLFLSELEQEQLRSESHLLEDFLEASFGKEYPNLIDYVKPILSASGLLPTADTLAYAETNLAIRWLLKEGNRDPRFLLRKELQLKRVTGRYDVVLLDCPPLVNVCCVNAMAASDYVLIPILPSSQATARVPVLLRRVCEFRDNINSAIKVLGIVANRTQRSELTHDEESRLLLLRDQSRDILGHDVPLFDTFIRQSVEVRIAEDSHRPLRPEDTMFEAFHELAREVVLHFPSFCHPNRPLPATKEVTP